jgi:DNA-binding transcriptional MerR regulator
MMLAQRNLRSPVGGVRLFKIGDVMRQTGLSRQTVHNYTVLGLVSEASRTEGGHRLYDAAAVETLRRVIALRRALTLSEIRAKLACEQEEGLH